MNGIGAPGKFFLAFTNLTEIFVFTVGRIGGNFIGVITRIALLLTAATVLLVLIIDSYWGAVLS